MSSHKILFTFLLRSKYALKRKKKGFLLWMMINFKTDVYFRKIGSMSWNNEYIYQPFWLNDFKKCECKNINNTFYMDYIKLIKICFTCDIYYLNVSIRPTHPKKEKLSIRLISESEYLQIINSIKFFRMLRASWDFWWLSVPSSSE